VIGVGGDGAELIDFDHAVYGDFPLMLAIIGIATFLVRLLHIPAPAPGSQPSPRPYLLCLCELTITRKWRKWTC
jgi:hypothetical protein